MTEYEVISLIRESVAAINQDFEFYLSATFAVIVTCYVAGERLGMLLRVIIATLYLAATVLFYLRYGDIAQQSAYLFQLLVEMGSEFPQPQRGIHTWLRKGLMILGTLSALYMIFWPIKAGKGRATG